MPSLGNWILALASLSALLTCPVLLAWEYDDFGQFKIQAQQKLKSLSSRIAEISTKCDRISAAIDAIQQYSYQYNVKIVGVPQVSDQETSVQTANLCIKLFSALGAAGIDVKDLDTAHRVPAREASNRPNAIICKFISRLTRDEVMARRNEVRNLRPEDLSFDPSVKVDSIRLYDHFIPRVQELLFKEKKFQSDHGFAFCWAKNGSAFL